MKHQGILVALSLSVLALSGCAMDANEEVQVSAAAEEVRQPTCSDLETNCDRMGGSFDSHIHSEGGSANWVIGTCEYPNGQTQDCSNPVAL